MTASRPTRFMLSLTLLLQVLLAFWVRLPGITARPRITFKDLKVYPSFDQPEPRDWQPDARRLADYGILNPSAFVQKHRRYHFQHYLHPDPAQRMLPFSDTQLAVYLDNSFTMLKLLMWAKHNPFHEPTKASDPLQISEGYGLMWYTRLLNDDLLPDKYVLNVDNDGTELKVERPEMIRWIYRRNVGLVPFDIVITPQLNVGPLRITPVIVHSFPVSESILIKSLYPHGATAQNLLELRFGRPHVGPRWFQRFDGTAPGLTPFGIDRCFAPRQRSGPTTPRSFTQEFDELLGHDAQTSVYENWQKVKRLRMPTDRYRLLEHSGPRFAEQGQSSAVGHQSTVTGRDWSFSRSGVNHGLFSGAQAELPRYVPSPTSGHEPGARALILLSQGGRDGLRRPAKVDDPSVLRGKRTHGPTGADLGESLDSVTSSAFIGHSRGTLGQGRASHVPRLGLGEQSFERDNSDFPSYRKSLRLTLPDPQIQETTSPHNDALPFSRILDDVEEASTRAPLSGIFMTSVSSEPPNLDRAHVSFLLVPSRSTCFPSLTE